jgi:hypothetical protein
MTMTRQGFIRLLVVTTGTAAFTQACGDDTGTGGSGTGGGGGSGGDGSGATGGATSSSPSSTTSGNSTTTTGGMAGCEPDIQFNHSHVLEIAIADLDSTADKTYDIMGGSPHGHSVTITGAQFATLKGGGSVMVTSTDGGADMHSHRVTINCTV